MSLLENKDDKGNRYIQESLYILWYIKSKDIRVRSGDFVPY